MFFNYQSDRDNSKYKIFHLYFDILIRKMRKRMKIFFFKTNTIFSLASYQLKMHENKINFAWKNQLRGLARWI